MTAAESEEPAARVTAELTEALNRHGYAFQHAVSKRAEELFQARRSYWSLEGVEVPVETKGAVTHVDLVLRIGNSDVHLVGECKRVDPALSRWGFARAPYTRWNTIRDSVILEELVPHASSKLVSRPFAFHGSVEPYHIGLELRRRDVKGDGTGGGRDSIVKAVTQVLRGASGLAEYYSGLSWRRVSERHFRFVPVVFTTAELWVTEANISEADLASGLLSGDGIETSQVGWLWFNYNLTPHLRHSLSSEADSSTLAKALEAEATRSAAIVSPEGIDDFLSLDFSVE